MLEFLEYMAKTELGPASGLPYYNVTFTVPEIRAAVRDMTEGGVLYLRFQREQQAQETGGEEKCNAFAQQSDSISEKDSECPVELERADKLSDADRNSIFSTLDAFQQK